MDTSEYLVVISYLFLEMALVILVTYGLSMTKWCKEIVANKLTPVNCLVFIVIFGVLSIIGTYLAADYETSKVNMRDFPVIIAGFLGGPMIGTGAGLIGGIERYFQGGVTALPCALSTILSGIVAGLVHMHYKGFPKMHVAIITSVVLMTVHMVLVAFISDPVDAGTGIVKVIALPMMTFAILGMVVFSYLYTKSWGPKTVN
jgi:two-component system sensor histidine kinase LytS